MGIVVRLIILFCFTSIKSLKADNIPSVDPRLIPNIEESLEILQNPEYADVIVNKLDNRPQKCPLRSETKLASIQQQLESIAQALKFGECYDKNRQLIDGLEVLLTEENQLFTYLLREDSPENSSNNNSQENQSALRRQQIFNVLKAVSNDDACLYNVRKRGLLPVMADVVTNIGQVSSLIPTPNGFYLSAGAVSLGTALKIMVSIFGSPFNWNEINERTQFLELNCNFFDLRRELESAEVIQIRDDQIPNKIQRSKEVSVIIKTYLSKIKKQKNATINHINNLKENYLTSELPENTLEISENIDHVDSEIPVIDIGSHRKKLNTIQVLTHHLTILTPKIDQYRIDLPFKENLVTLCLKMSWDKLQENIATKNNLFQQNVLEPIHYYLNLFQKELAKIISIKDKEFSSFTKSENGLSNGQIIEEIERNYEQIFLELAKTISFIETRIEILSTKNSKNSLDAYDDGAHTIYDILENYHFIQSLLIGRLGYSYLDYFRKKMSQGLDEFKNSFYRFKKKYLSNRAIDELYLDLWPCRDANDLRLIWERVSSASEVANDFIQTNTGIFKSDVRNTDTFLRILPVRQSREQAMLKYVRSAEYATSMINGEIPIDRKKLRRIELIDRRNLGLLFLKRMDYEGKRIEVERFWGIRDCGSVL